MCLLAIFYRMVDDAPLVVGANREESCARPALPPQILDGPARAVAGVDVLAGGTWFGDVKILHRRMWEKSLKRR